MIEIFITHGRTLEHAYESARAAADEFFGAQPYALAFKRARLVDSATDCRPANWHVEFTAELTPVQSQHACCRHSH